MVALGAACFYAYAKEVRAGRITPLGVVYIGGFAAGGGMLVVLSFGKNDSPYRNAVLHVLYYMAQIFIALTIQFA